MKYLIAFFLLVSFPLQAQEKPPEARAFKEGVTSFQQYEEQKRSGSGKADAKTPDARSPNVEIWLPPQFQASEEKWPLLVFSHGFGGCAKQSSFLTSFLADQGYIVIAPDHADADCRGRVSGGMRAGKAAWPERPFRSPESWNDKTEADRKDDILFAIESLLDDRMYKNYVDTDRMGLIGHSLGGYTVLGLAGAWPSWKDKRFKAVLALSPFAAPFIVSKGLRKVHVPVMYQGGTKDTGITPALKKGGGGGYALTPAPKYFLEFQGAGHFAWTELEEEHHAIIQESALAFFNKYIKGNKSEIAYEAKGQVKTFWKDEDSDAEGEKGIKPSVPSARSPSRVPMQ